MRVNSISSAYQSSAVQRVQYENQNGSVSKVNTAAQSDTSKDDRNSHQQIITDEKDNHRKQNILPTNEVMDFAINKDMNIDKNLIGSTSKLDTLDIQKAISDMKKDSIIREYQTFVKNPVTIDGIVHQL